MKETESAGDDHSSHSRTPFILHARFAHCAHIRLRPQPFGDIALAYKTQRKCPRGGSPPLDEGDLEGAKVKSTASQWIAKGRIECKQTVRILLIGKI